MLPTKFRFIWQSGFRGEVFRNRPIRNKNCLQWPCLFTNRDEMSSFIEDLLQMLPTKFRFILQSGFRGDFQKSTNQKQEFPVAAMFVNGSGPNEHSLQRTFHRYFLRSFGSFGKVVSEEIFRNRPIRNKNFLWWPCLLTDWDQMSNLYRGPSIDASYQVSVHLAEGFQRRRLKCEKLTDDRRRKTDDGRQTTYAK